MRPNRPVYLLRLADATVVIVNDFSIIIGIIAPHSSKVHPPKKKCRPCCVIRAHLPRGPLKQANSNSLEETCMMA